MEPTLAVILDNVKTLGFPVFVALWLMFRTDKLLTNLTTAIVELSKMVERQSK